MSLKDRLHAWFKNHPGTHASGTIQRMVAEKTTYTPSNVSRRLRELEVEKKLKVTYEGNHAFYQYYDGDTAFWDAVSLGNREEDASKTQKQNPPSESKG